MATPAVLVEELDLPTLRFGESAPTAWSAYAAVSIDAAVNLTEDRRFRDIPLSARLQTAVSEQRTFLNSLLDPDLQAVFDLRIIRRPDEHLLRQAIIVRTLAGDAATASRRAQELAQMITAIAPDHVLTSVVSDDRTHELQRLRDPFESEIADAAFVVREEVTAPPVRPDLRKRFEYLYTVVPFGTGTVDWSPLYRRLMACQDPVVVSIAIQPRVTSVPLARLLNEYATVYGQLAQSDRQQAGVFTGEQSLAAESIAVDAAAAFADYSQRLGQRHFAIRTLVASPKPLAAGLAQTLGGIVSPAGAADGESSPVRSAATVYRLRSSEAAGQIASWDLHAVDLIVPPGAPTIWGRPSPPPDPLADLPMIGDARDAGGAFRLPAAAAGDLPGVQVRRGRSGHAEASAGGDHPILLGKLADTDAQLSVDVNSLSKHALIAGSTGSGKTTMVLEILRQLWPAADASVRRVPFLVIEPVNDVANDYRKLLNLPEFENDLVVFTVGDERSRPLRFNPFAVPEGVLVGEHMSALLAAFKAAFGLFDPLPAIYEEAIAETYASAGILPSETSDGEATNWPTVVGFSLAMTRATSGLGYSGDVKANLESSSVIRAKQLLSGPCASVFRTNRILDAEWLLTRPVIVELKTLGSSEEQALLIALLINAITEHYKANRGAQSELQHVTVIEEAHRLLARAKGGGGSAQSQAKEQAAEAFANVLAENRKYGEGIIIAEQIPSKLVEDAVKNTNLKVMCRLTAEEERDYLGQSMAMSPEQRLAAPRLKRGEAMVYSDELAYTTEVLTPFTLVDADGRGLETPDTVGIERTVPFDACEVCQSRCAWRPAGLALSRRPQLAEARDAFVTSLYAKRNGDGDGHGDDPPSGADASRHLAKLVAAEVRRYPRIDGPGAAGDVALCTVVHLLESRLKNAGWIRNCARQASKLARPSEASVKHG